MDLHNYGIASPFVMDISYPAAKSVGSQYFLIVTRVASIAITPLWSVELFCGGGSTMMDRATRTNQGPCGKRAESSIHLRQRAERGGLQDFC